MRTYICSPQPPSPSLPQPPPPWHPPVYSLCPSLCPYHALSTTLCPCPLASRFRHGLYEVTTQPSCFPGRLPGAHGRLWLLLFSNKREKGGGARSVMLCSAMCLPSGIPLSNEAASPRSSFNSPSSGDAQGGVVAGRAVH